jgi:N-glycosylase/DNA lyase
MLFIVSTPFPHPVTLSTSQVNNFFVNLEWDIAQGERVVLLPPPCLLSLTPSRYLYESSKLVLSHGGAEWLLSLRQLPYAEIQAALVTLPGIGRKVADCISLFSLNQIDVIPVDTHIWAITNRDYSSHSSLLQAMGSSRKTLTPKIYEEIQQIFKKIFEQYVGWAQSLLFAGELSDFRKLLPLETQEEMKEYERNEREQKKIVKKRRMEDEDDREEEREPEANQKKNIKRK